MRAWLAALLSAGLLLAAPAGAAQQANRGALRVTVVDTTGAVLVGANVTISGVEPATAAVTKEPVVTSEQGIAVIAELLPGRYAVQAEFPGFQTQRLPDVRVRAGENRQVVALPIEAQRDQVVVQQDRQTAASDPRGTFGTTLTREQLEALSDDPEVLRQQLQEMAGPGATISVDSFEGAALPPKAQIRSIRISRDQFAAENHSAGGVSVEIITQPGMGPVRFNTGMRMRGDGLSGRSPFTPTRGPSQDRNYFFGMNGTLVPNKASFGLYVNGFDSYDTPNINVVRDGTTRSEAVALRSPRQGMFANGNVDYALTLDQTLRFGFNLNRFENRNLGVGAYDEETRAFASEQTALTMRVQHLGPLGRRAFLRNRLMVSFNDSDQRSAVEAVTIQVNDSFTSGGAQVAGGRHTRTFTAGSDLDYVRGLHTFRTGLEIVGGTYRSDDRSNYLGTYTFESSEAYAAGQPRSYTRRTGDPNVSYRNVQGGLYLQDDIRVRRNLTLSAGVRYELQTHVHDYNNLGPRVGFTWSPFASGATTLRSSWGLFYDWFNTNTFEQTIRIDGFHQQEINIQNPAFPVAADFNGLSSGIPLNRYVLGDTVRHQRLNRVSVGIDQRLLPKLQSTVTFAYTRGENLARGMNLNAPIDGVRPNPAFANIVDVVSDASSRQRQLSVNLTANPGALLPLGANAPRVNWKRVTMFFNYTLGSINNNTEGAFSLSPTGSIDTEWGPAGGFGDVRHRMNLTLNNQIVRNLMLSFFATAQTGMPYSIRTGADNNGDSLFNDRPVGISRNSERGAAHLALNGQIAYALAFGRAPSGLPPGVTVIGAGGGGPVSIQTFEQPPRYRVQIFAGFQNLTNRANYSGYSGTQTSRFFGQPTSVTNPRRVDFGFNISF